MVQSTRHDVIVTPAGDDLMIYDQARHVIHHLNPTAARVWQEAERSTDAAAIANRLNLPVDTVLEAFHQLAEAQLLSIPTTPPTQTRRHLLKRAAMAGIVAPVVISVTAPMAAAQASTCTSPPNPVLILSFGDDGSSWSVTVIASGFCPNVNYLGLRYTRQNGGPQSSGSFANFVADSTGAGVAVIGSVPKGGGYEVKYHVSNSSTGWVAAPD